MTNNNPNENLEGTLYFETINIGSNSEHRAPVLHIYGKDKKPTPKHVVLANLKDKTSIYSSFIPYDGKNVKVQGKRFWGKFIVNSIEEIF